MSAGLRLGLACVALVLGSVGVASASPQKVRVTPSPFYADETKMRVQFVTPEPAKPGRRYYVWWQTLAAHGTLPSDCSPSSNIVDQVGVRGGTRKTVAVILKIEPILGDYFCPGPSKIDIFTQKSNAKGLVADSATKATYKLITTHRFRVLRP